MRRDRGALERNNHFAPGPTWAGFNKEDRRKWEMLVECVMFHAAGPVSFAGASGGAMRSSDLKSETISYATQGHGAVRDWVSLCVYSK